MKKYLITLCLVAIANLGYSARPALDGSREQILSEVESVEVDGEINLTIVQEPSLRNPRIEYNTKDGDPKYFDIKERKNGKLSISERKQKERATITEVTLYVTSLKSIEASQADVWVKGFLKTPILDITLTSEAKFSGELYLLDLKMDLSGKSVAHLTGDARYLDITTSGSNVAAPVLSTMSSIVEASQRANVEVMASDRVEASVSTGAKVYYSGEPSVVRTYEAFLGGTISQVK